MTGEVKRPCSRKANACEDALHGKYYDEKNRTSNDLRRVLYHVHFPWLDYLYTGV